MDMLPKKTSKRGTVSFRVDASTWEFINHLKRDKFIDVSSWMRAVLADAIVKVKDHDGKIQYGAPEKLARNAS